MAMFWTENNYSFADIISASSVQSVSTGQTNKNIIWKKNVLTIYWGQRNYSKTKWTKHWVFISKLDMTGIKKILLVQYDGHSMFNLLSFHLYSNNKKRISEEDKKQKSFYYTRE